VIVVVRAKITHVAAGGANVSKLRVAVLVLRARVVSALHPAVQGQPCVGHPGRRRHQQQTPNDPHVRPNPLSSRSSRKT